MHVRDIPTIDALRALKATISPGEVPTIRINAAADHGGWPRKIFRAKIRTLIQKGFIEQNRRWLTHEAWKLLVDA